MDNLLPYPKIQHLKNLVDLMYNNAKDLLSKKRLALKEGDEVVMQQIGEGKDVMSILREYNSFHPDSSHTNPSQFEQTPSPQNPRGCQKKNSLHRWRM